MIGLDVEIPRRLRLARILGLVVGLVAGRSGEGNVRTAHFLESKKNKFTSSLPWLFGACGARNVNFQLDRLLGQPGTRCNPRQRTGRPLWRKIKNPFVMLLLPG